MRLFYAAGDTLILRKRTELSPGLAGGGNLKEVSRGSGHQETHISDAADSRKNQRRDFCVTC